jgi:hypothetical protein
VLPGGAFKDNQGHGSLGLCFCIGALGVAARWRLGPAAAATAGALLRAARGLVLVLVLGLIIFGQLGQEVAHDLRSALRRSL